MKTGGHLRTVGRLAAGAGVAVALLAAFVGVGAPIVVRGERFGRLVERMLPATRGRIQVGGGAWTWRAVLALVRERPSPLTLDDVRITDPEGTRVLRLGRVSARLELHRDPLRIVLHELRVEDADWTFARMKGENEIGFLAAFAPRKGAPASKPEIATAEISIPGARLDRLTAVFDLPGWGLVLRDVRAGGSLEARAGDGARAPLTFEVRGAECFGGGQLRVLDGADALELPFSHARLDRVATTAAAPDAVRVEASAITAGRSTLTLAGTFAGTYGLSPASHDPGLTLEAHVADAADAADAVTRGRGLDWTVPLGPGANLALRLDGPFSRLHADLTLASAALGRVSGDATVHDRGVAGGATFTDFRPGAFLPLPLLPFASGTLDGTIRGRFQLDGAATLDGLALLLTRPTAMGAPRFVRVRAGPRRGPRPAGPTGWGVDLSGARYAAGVIRLPRVAFKLLGGRLSASGRVAIRDARETRWLPSPVVDLDVRARDLSIESLLGETFVRGGTGFRAHVRGPLRDLAVELALAPRSELTVLGQRFELPPRLELRLADDVVFFDGVRLGGPEGSTLVTSGRVAMSGRLGFGIVVHDFPFNRLPGLAQTGLPIAGRVSGELHLAGGSAAPAVSGQLALDPVTFQGRPVGGGAVTITPGPHGAIRAHGRLLEGIEADGVLEPKPSGMAGHATLELVKLRLDPFLPELPGGIAATSVLSGRVVARVAPGRPAEAEGWLSELTLVVSPPPGRGRSHPIELHADGEIHLAAQTGDGPLTLGPARFRGNVGAFELAGESRGDDLRGTLRGRIELGPFAPLAAPWLEHLAGAVDVDLVAARVGAKGDLTVDGSVSVAAPLAFRASALPVEARVPSGRILLRGTTVETTGFPVSVRAERLAEGALRNLEADLRVDAHLGGTPAAPTARASVSIDRLAAQVPALGPQPIVGEHGTVLAENRKRALEITEVDLPFRGEARGISAAGTRIDQASFTLRLRGDPRRKLTLSGDVQIGAARVAARAVEAGAAPTGLAAHKELDNARLDVRVRSQGGAVVVEVPKLPDLRVDLDLHVGGTPKHPVVTGEPRGANLYSRLLLALRRLFS